MTIEIVNKDAVLKYIENLKKSALEGTKEGVKNAAFFVQNEVKQSIAGQRGEPTSVKTGRFLNSVDVKDGNNDMEQIVFTDIPYAKFLEYGTSKMEPREHFTATARRINAQVKEIVKDNVKL